MPPPKHITISQERAAHRQEVEDYEATIAELRAELAARDQRVAELEQNVIDLTQMHKDVCAEALDLSGQLEDEIENRGDTDIAAGMVEAERDAAQAQVVALQFALRKYGVHVEPECAYWSGVECDCGLAAALAQAPEAAAARREAEMAVIEAARKYTERRMYFLEDAPRNEHKALCDAVAALDAGARDGSGDV